MKHKCFKPFIKVYHSNDDSSNIVSFWGTLSPRPSTGALPLDLTGWLSAPDPLCWTP